MIGVIRFGISFVGVHRYEQEYYAKLDVINKPQKFVEWKLPPAQSLPKRKLQGCQIAVETLVVKFMNVTSRLRRRSDL